MSILKNYKYLGSNGGGFFAIVKRYEDVTSRRKVAVKELKGKFRDNQDYVNRFNREIKLLQDLAGHPNIVELIDAETTGRNLCYVMPLATYNLGKYYELYNSILEIEDRVEIFDQILSAVQFAHSKGVLHRDINPNNILVFVGDEERRINVCDFGLGKSLESLSARTRSHAKGYGQPFYTAPEQFQRLNQATAKSDIYSLGRVLDFVLTGRIPHDVQESDFSTVVRKAVEQNPSKRYQNIEKFAEDYEHIKGLLLTSQASSVDILKEYVRNDRPIDWYHFHKLATTPVENAGEHIYFAYLEPVVTLLTKEQNLEDYHDAVGSSFNEFMIVFAKYLRECTGSLGWPFSSVDSFVSFLHSVFCLNTDNRVKLLCLTELWVLAYEGDRYKAQDIITEIFQRKQISKAIEMGFALAISKGRKSGRMKRLLSFSPPNIVKEAIKGRLAEDTSS